MSSMVAPPGFSLFSAEAFAGLVFLVTLAMVISGAVFAVTCHRMVHAVGGLTLSFTGLAGVYYFLLSPFVAMMQLLICGGAVALLITFVAMMVRPEGSDVPTEQHRSPLAGPVGGVIAALLFAAFGLLTLKTQWPVFERSGTFAISEVGMSLLTTYSLIFELISIVVLMVIIGALVIVRRGKN
ncbi:MAG: NADH-quinone oxidoreductase subunit J [Deltaproteobacteria bacterium]|nr:MAG: NADH-quinone oxidoreductase subunit J [Deltaproteobacteria bacterium]